MNRYCTSCGAPAAETDFYCSKCGGTVQEKTPVALQDWQKPDNWLTKSILVTIFCFAPFGIVGIVNAAQVNKKFDAGDLEGAQKTAAQAKKWVMNSFWVGLVFGILYSIYIFLN